jgi:tripartite-type tricarboxylate transporter receptor subunit TctC
MKHILKTCSAAALMAMSLLAAPATAADLAGETVEWTIPFGVGGGTDVWARFFAPQLSDALPGHPTVVVLNVPGGGSITGANQFAMRAKPSGLEVLGTSASTQYPAILGDPRVRYDYANWTPVLASPTGGVVYINPQYGIDGADDIEALRQTDMRFASQGPTQLELPALLAFKILGMQVKPVFGMESRGQGRLAFERGEAGIDFQTTTAYLTSVIPLIEAGKAVPLFALGVVNADGSVSRDPSYPDLPSFPEFFETATGAAPAGEAYEAWKAMMLAGFSLQKMIVVPADAPEEMKQMWRDAVQTVVDAPDFREKAGEELGAYQQLVGSDAEAALAIVLDMDPAAKDWLKNWLTTDYDVRF